VPAWKAAGAALDAHPGALCQSHAYAPAHTLRAEDAQSGSTLLNRRKAVGGRLLSQIILFLLCITT
jgi:hypothetical protein